MSNKVKQVVLNPEIIELIKEKLSIVSRFENSDKNIKREREKAENTYKLSYNAFGFDSNEYFFLNDKSFYCYHEILNSKFDSASFLIKGDNIELFLANIIVDGLATYLLDGWKTMLIWAERNISRDDFIEIELNKEDTKYYLEQLNTVIDKSKCENLDFLFEYNLEAIIENIQFKMRLYGERGFTVLSGEEAIKYMEDMFKNREEE